MHDIVQQQCLFGTDYFSSMVLALKQSRKSGNPTGAGVRLHRKETRLPKQRFWTLAVNHELKIIVHISPADSLRVALKFNLVCSGLLE